MRILTMMVAVATLVVSAPSAAQTITVAPEQQAAIDLAEERGALIYAYDQAAWHATDDMLAKLPDAASSVGGWIVDGPVGGPTAIFFDRDPQQPHAVYEAHFRSGALVDSKVLGPDDDRALSAERLRLIRARRAALEAFGKAEAKMCSPQRPNTVVLPPEQPDGAVLVYLLTPQPDLKRFPLGGHYRVAIAPDGTVGDVRSFANSCLMMSPPEGDGKKPEMFFVTHLLDPVPTEIHVFTSLAAHLPIGVMTTANKRLWIVDGAHIEPTDFKPD
jgi:hypothetical protein